MFWFLGVGFHSSFDDYIKLAILVWLIARHFRLSIIKSRNQFNTFLLFLIVSPFLFWIIAYLKGDMLLFVEVFVFFFLMLGVRNSIDINDLTRGARIYVLFSLIFAFLQVLNVDFGYVLYKNDILGGSLAADTAVSNGRIIGVASSIGYFGFWFVLAIFISRFSKKHVLALILLAIFFDVQRAMTLVLVCYAIYLYLPVIKRVRPRHVLYIFLIASIISIFFFTIVNHSLESNDRDRLLLLDAALNHILERGIAPLGLTAVEYYNSIESLGLSGIVLKIPPHNNILNHFIFNGYLGVLLLFISIVYLYRVFYFFRLMSSEDQYFNSHFLFALVSIYIYGMFHNLGPFSSSTAFIVLLPFAYKRFKKIKSL